MSALKVHIRLSFIFNDGEGAGVIRWVAPVVYDDPPLHKKFFFIFLVPPSFVTQINGDDPPPQEHIKGKKIRREKSASLSLSPNETVGSPEACLLGKI